MMTKLLLPFLLLFFTLDGVGQITFEKNISMLNSSIYMPIFIKNSPENDFVIAGETISNISDKSVFLMKTNELGEPMWTKKYSVINNRLSLANLETLNDGYLLNCIQAVTVNYNITYKIFLIKTNLVGEIIWTKAFNAGFSINDSELIKTEDGGFAIFANSYGYNDRSCFLLKVDSLGIRQWGKRYTDPILGVPVYDLAELNGHFYLTVYPNKIVKLDSVGNYISANNIVSQNNDTLNAIRLTKTNDNHLIIRCDDKDINNNKYTSLIKIDSSEIIKWSKHISYGGITALKYSQFSTDNGFFLDISSSVCGSTYSSCEYSAKMIKLDENGNFEYGYQTPFYENTMSFTGITETSDNGFAAITAFQGEYNPNFLKLDSLGKSICNFVEFPNYEEYNINCTFTPSNFNVTIVDDFTPSPITVSTTQANPPISTICFSADNVDSSDSLFVTNCDSFTLNGETYTSSDEYIQLIPNNSGSFDTLNLYLNLPQSYTSTEFVTACTEYYVYGSYEEPVYESGVYLVYSGQSNAGCDSSESITLTINNSYSSILNASACENFTLNNITYYQSGVHFQILQNSNGCDSAIQLNLVINQNLITLNESACNSYSLNNQTYTQSGTYIQTFQNVAGCDSIITLNLTINNPTTATLNETACSYSLNNQTYTQSGTYIQTLQNVAGCDSTITLNLTIINSTTSNLNETACNSYSLNNQTYMQSGTYIQTLQNVNGCDSTITLNLTIINSTTSNLNETACNSYSLNNQTYTQSGTYIQNLQNVAGCDSTITLNLTINNPTTATLIETACNSYSLNNQTYTQSGTYIQTLQNVAGCDSTITLNLTINNPTTSTLNETACNSYSLNNQTYTQSGTYIQNLQNVAGCDSTITLNLTINNPTTATLIETACNSYSLNNQTYTQSGTYIQTLQNVAGCDSTITLNLTINNSTNSTLNETACNSYSLNNQTYTQSGSYIQTLQNVAGCDSTITLSITINNSTTATLNETACDSYSLNNQTYSQSGTYIQNLQNLVGCDSTITLNLTIININPAITNNSNILTAQQAGASYQWIDCDLDAIIPGATNQSFTPTHVGEYAVRLTIGNCTETSNCVMVNNVSLEENQLENGFEIFPNPFTSEAKIVFNIPQTNTKIQLLDVLGKELQSGSFSGSEYIIYRESLSASMYYVQITDASGKVATTKIVLE